MRRRLSILAVLLLAAQAHGATIYLGTATDWQSAIQSGASNDVFIMSNGVYSVTNNLAVPAYVTVRGDNRAAIFDGGGTCRVIRATGAGIVLDGLTIRNGFLSDTNMGGGIHGFSTLQKTVVTNCYAYSNSVGTLGGGAVFVSAYNSTFMWNKTTNTATAGWGGGAGLVESHARGCTIVSNAAGRYGGGISGIGTVTTTNSPIIDNCEIAYNTGSIYGIGVMRAQRVANSSVSSNSGIGIYLDAVYAVSNCVVAGNALAGITYANVYYSTITGNRGGGLYSCNAFSCFIYGNSTYSGGAGMFGYGSYAAKSCVIYGNVATGSVGGGVSGGMNTYSCTIVSNRSTHALGGGNVYQGTHYNGIIFGGVTNDFYIVPALTNCWTNAVAFESGWRLPANETNCIDTGNDTYTTWSNDVYGLSRIIGPASDIGASEYQPTPAADERRRFFFGLN